MNAVRKPQPATAAAPPSPGACRNPGFLPAEARRQRVRVWLANGQKGAEDGNPMSPPGWAADGRGGCRWSLTGDPFDIEWYEVVR